MTFFGAALRFPAFLETKNQFPRQGWSSLKLSLKSKIFNENGQLVGEGGGGNGNEKGNQSNIPLDKQRKKVMWPF